MADAFYDANRFFGRVLYVLGPGLDQPVAATRVNYADASDIHTGAVTWQTYAPFSLIGLWNNQGRVDRVVYGGTAAPGQTALCVDPGTQYRCVFPGIDWGEFPYTRPGQATHTWQGTVMVDKPDATGTYYRRNRSYDPNTARFTQEDPLGLAGGLNVYGFNGGDPVNFSDPFGLCAGPSDIRCTGQARLPGVILPAVLGGIGGAAKRFWSKHGADILALGMAVISDGMSEGMPAPEGVGLTPSGLRGKSMQEVEKIIPDTWAREPTAKGGGTRYTHPTNKGEQIRVQPGTPTDPNPAKQGPYCRISRCGQVSDPIPLKGNPTLPQSGQP